MDTGLLIARFTDHVLIIWFQNTGIKSPGVKQQKREACHLPASSKEVKKAQISTFLPLEVFMALCLTIELKVLINCS
jgi:hypothetical protein